MKKQKTEKMFMNIWKAQHISNKQTSKEEEIWSDQNEQTYYEHKRNLKERLVGQASTAPWDKVLMGSYTKLYKS